jgi:calcium/calmodulin-dependent protein kinase I
MARRDSGGSAQSVGAAAGANGVLGAAASHSGMCYGAVDEYTGYLRQDTRPVPFVSVKLRRFVRLHRTYLSLAKSPTAEVIWSFDIAGANVDAYANDKRISIWLTDSMRRRRRVIVLCATDEKDFARWARWLKRASQAVLELHYEMSAYINTGSFARVVLGHDRHNGREVAIKLIEKSNAPPSERQYMQRELDIMSRVQHPNIVTCLDIFDSPLRTRIVMEYMTGGILSDVVSKREKDALREHEAREILRDVLSGLQYLHAQGIVHRDIKPSNILLSSKKYPYSPVKLSDFGLSNYVSDDRSANGRDKNNKNNKNNPVLTSAVGSPAFVAPELFDANYGPPVDLWSVGVVLFVMLAGGRLPFTGNTSTDVLLNVKRGAVDMRAIPRARVSDGARNLLLSLLNIDVDKRLTATQALEHPWLHPRVADSVAPRPPLPPCAQPIGARGNKHLSIPIAGSEGDRKRTQPSGEDAERAVVNFEDEDDGGEDVDEDYEDALSQMQGATATQDNPIEECATKGEGELETAVVVLSDSSSIPSTRGLTVEQRPVV